MNVRADNPDWLQLPRALDERLVGVADARLEIVLAGARLAPLLGFEAASLQRQNLLQLTPDESSRTLLLLALQGVASEVELPSSLDDTILVARGAATGAERSLLLYERSAANAKVKRASGVRARHFVGRETELASFDRFLVSSDPSILYVQGPFGIGKTALLGAFEARCGELRCAYVKVDARSSPMCEQAIVDALSATAGAGQTDLARLLASSRICARNWVLFIDNFDAWFMKASAAFREVFELLPPGIRIVLAGRRPPDRQWWSGGTREAVTISLEAIDRESSEALLRLHASRPEARAEILSVANGHPLCLVTLANGSRVQGNPAAAAENLVETGVDPKLPLPRLEIAALPARITEDVLAELLDEGPGAHDVYDVLTTVCTRDISGIGLRMPWCLRTAVTRRLSARSPERYATLRGRLAACYARRLDQCTQLPTTLIGDILDSFADVPLLKMLIGESSELRVRRAGAGDLPQVIAAARRLGGELAPALVERRMRQGNGLGATHIAMRDGTIEGLVQIATASMDEASRSARDGADAPMAAAVEALRELDGLEAGAPVAICTAWLTSELHGDARGPTSRALSQVLLRKVLTATPRRVAAAFVMPSSEPRLPLLLFPGFQTVRIGGYAVVVRDLRGVSAGSALLALVDSAEMPDSVGRFDGLGSRDGVEDDLPVRTLITVDNVRSALMHLAWPERLAASPIASSYMVEAATTPDGSVADRATTLARLLRSAIDSMGASPRDAKARDVLLAVFCGAGGKHEQIARDVGLPYGTFRRHLTHGIERVTEMLGERDRDALLEAPRHLGFPSSHSVEHDLDAGDDEASQ